MLENLTPRGAVGANPLMGDGAGILIQILTASSAKEMAKQGVTLPKAGECHATRRLSPASRR